MLFVTEICCTSRDPPYKRELERENDRSPSSKPAQAVRQAARVRVGDVPSCAANGQRVDDTHNVDDTRRAANGQRVDDTHNIDDTRRAANGQRVDDTHNVDDTRREADGQRVDAGHACRMNRGQMNRPRTTGKRFTRHHKRADASTHRSCPTLQSCPATLGRRSA